MTKKAIDYVHESTMRQLDNIAGINDLTYSDKLLEIREIICSAVKLLVEDLRDENIGVSEFCQIKLDLASFYGKLISRKEESVDEC